MNCGRFANNSDAILDDPGISNFAVIQNCVKKVLIYMDKIDNIYYNISVGI
jgi:hypothetical protein